MDKGSGFREHLFTFVLGLLIIKEISCKEIKQFQGDKRGDGDPVHVLFKRATDVSDAESIYSYNKQYVHSEATYYGEYPGGGACSLDPLSPMASQPGWIRVAAGSADFRKSLGCGMCVEIKGSGKGSGANPVTGVLKAVVHDLCGGCAKGGYDLYITGDGRWEIESKAIDCPTVPGQDGNIMFRFVDNNLWSFKLQARNIKVPVAGIEVLKNGKYHCLKRTGDNYFTGDGLGKVEMPLTIRLTAVTGEQRETVLPSMLTTDIPSDVQFSGFAVGPGPSSIKCAGQGKKPPYPSGGMTPGEEGGPTSPLPPPVNPPPPSPPVEPNTGGGGISAPGTASGGGAAGSDFCKGKNDGIHPDPDDCAGLIICNIGKAHRQKCAPPQLFRTDSMNCDLPERVDCGSRPRKYGDNARRFDLSEKPSSDYGSYAKPSITAASYSIISYDKRSTVHEPQDGASIQQIPAYKINMNLEKANGHILLYKPNKRNQSQENQPQHRLSVGSGGSKLGGPSVEKNE